MQNTLFEQDEINDLGLDLERLDRSRFVLDEHYLKAICNRIKDRVSFDVETTDYSNQAELIGFALTWRDWDDVVKESVLSSVYVPVAHITKVPQIRVDIILDYIQKLFNRVEVIAFNVGFEKKVMKRYGVKIPNYDDVQYYSHSFDETNGKKSLKVIAKEVLNLEWGTIKTVAGKKRKGKVTIETANSSVEALGNYCIGDTEATLLLYEYFKPKVIHALPYIIPLEKKITPVVIAMETRGMRVDFELLREKRKETEENIELAKSAAYNSVGKIFNVASPQQVAQVLFDELKLPPIKNRSTDVEVLETLKGKHPFIDSMLSLRNLEHLLNNDITPLFEKSVNGRIHYSLNQLGPGTGRFSSSDINIQNRPPEIRDCLIASEGYNLIDVDFSQIEGRIFAHITQDPVLLKYYREGGDIHQSTSEKLGIPRKAAKSCNFCIIYLGKPAKIQEILIKEGFNYDLKDATELVNGFWKVYKKAEVWKDEVIRLGHENKYAETIWGRRRRWPNINDYGVQIDTPWGGKRYENQSKINAMERELVNHYIQGSAADIMKFALVDVQEAISYLPEGTAYSLATVHDEYLGEAREEETEYIKNLVGRRMEDAVLLSIPLKTEGKSGKRWSQTH